jgi:translation initiation factor IF-2
MTSRIEENGSSVQGGDAVQEQDAIALRPLQIPSALTLSDLAALMDVGPVEVIKEFMRTGHMLTINDVVEHDLAASITPLFGYDAQPLAARPSASSSKAASDEEDPSLLEPRPPVVTILGHVDHGKTTLLDSIRDSKVVAGEAGGITQHIGAYQVDYNGSPITFLDTPGHKAFTAMRSRGAQVTDVAVLVVAADDGIMPQTEEAIDHARAAEVPIVVAINKVDLPDSDVERVKRQLAEHDLLIEEWGGEVIAVPVSALAGDGISDLLENILAVAEIGELKANPNRDALGTVVEARIDKSKGTVATVLVQTGTLRVGDNVVAGAVRGRVKAMINDVGDRIKAAGPSHPVELLGLDGLPEAGDLVQVTSDEKTARQMVAQRLREKEMQRSGGPTLEDVHSRMESGEVKALNLIVKTDVQGGIDAVRSSMESLASDSSRVNLVHAASGSITESDVLLAVASKAIVIGFNAEPEPGARALAGQEGIEIRFYDIIYNLIDDVELALHGLLDPVYEDVTEGIATVRQIFGVGRRTKAAGISITEGRFARDSSVRVMRNGQQVFEGDISSLKRFKDDVREITTGFEGGIMLDRFNDFEENDILEAHRTQKV